MIAPHKEDWIKPRVALIIGLNYVDDKPKDNEPETKKPEEVRGESFKPLPNALKDAEAVKELLLKKGSFKEGEVTLVRNPTKEELQKALTEFEESIKEHEGQCVAILYYAGHGIWSEDTGAHYMIPTDCKLLKDGRIKNGVSIDKRVEGQETGAIYMMNKAYTGIALIDACRVRGGSGGRGADYAEDGLSEGMGDVGEYEAMTCAASAVDAAMADGEVQGVRAVDGEGGSTAQAGDWVEVKGWLGAEMAPETESSITICYSCVPLDFASDGPEGGMGSPFRQAVMENLCDKHNDIESALYAIKEATREKTAKPRKVDGKVKKQDPDVKSSESRIIKTFNLVSESKIKRMEELYGLLHHISNANKPMGSRIDAGRKLWVLHFGSESRLEATQESCQCLLWIGGDKKIAETLEHVVNYELEPAKYVASYLCNVVKNLAVYERKRQGDAPLLQKTVIIPIVKLFCMATHQKGRDAARSALRNLIGGQDMAFRETALRAGSADRLRDTFMLLTGGDEHLKWLNDERKVDYAAAVLWYFMNLLQGQDRGNDEAKRAIRIASRNESFKSRVLAVYGHVADFNSSHGDRGKPVPRKSAHFEGVLDEIRKLLN